MKRSSFLKALAAIPIFVAFVKNDASPYNKDERSNGKLTTFKHPKTPDGDDGADGQDVYIYHAWADDASGTGFTLTFNAAKKYTAIRTSTTILTPVVGDFAGLWAKYIGENGDECHPPCDYPSASDYPSVSTGLFRHSASCYTV
jgi:hypothetical protein